MIHFTKKEFTCQCGCGFDAMDYGLITMLEAGREHFQYVYGNVVVEITSGNRCRAHNEEVQRKYVKNYVPFSSHSTHIRGTACDHKYWTYQEGHKIQVPVQEVYDWYDENYQECGLGLYSNRVHLDNRGNKARW